MSKVLETGELTTISGTKASDETKGGKISHKPPEDTNTALPHLGL